jgi:hypothetical protein
MFFPGKNIRENPFLQKFSADVGRDPDRAASIAATKQPEVPPAALLTTLASPLLVCPHATQMAGNSTHQDGRAGGAQAGQDRAAEGSR